MARATLDQFVPAVPLSLEAAAYAGLGMVLGLIQYVLGARHLGDAGNAPAPAESPQAFNELKRRTLLVTGVALVALALLVYDRTGDAIATTAG